MSISPRRTIKIDGETIVFNFNYNAFAELETQHDIYLTDLEDSFSEDKVSFDVLRKLLWAAQLKEGNTTIEEAGDVIERAAAAGKMQDLIECLTESLQAAVERFGQGMQAENSSGKPDKKN